MSEATNPLVEQFLINIDKTLQMIETLDLPSVTLDGELEKLIANAVTVHNDSPYTASGQLINFTVFRGHKIQSSKPVKFIETPRKARWGLGEKAIFDKIVSQEIKRGNERVSS